MSSKRSGIDWLILIIAIGVMFYFISQLEVVK